MSDSSESSRRPSTERNELGLLKHVDTSSSGYMVDSHIMGSLGNVPREELARGQSPFSSVGTDKIQDVYAVNMVGEN